MRTQYAEVSSSRLTPAYPYLELSGVVIVCCTLSALFQCNEREASEVRRAGCQENHCKGEVKCVNFTETQETHSVTPQDTGSHQMMQCISVMCERLLVLNKRNISHYKIQTNKKQQYNEM